MDATVTIFIPILLIKLKTFYTAICLMVSLCRKLLCQARLAVLPFNASQSTSDRYNSLPVTATTVAYEQDSNNVAFILGIS